METTVVHWGYIGVVLFPSQFPRPSTRTSKPLHTELALFTSLPLLRNARDLSNGTMFIGRFIFGGWERLLFRGGLSHPQLSTSQTGSLKTIPNIPVGL